MHHRELDFEFSRWNNLDEPGAQYVVQPHGTAGHRVSPPLRPLVLKSVLHFHSFFIFVHLPNISEAHPVWGMLQFTYPMPFSYAGDETVTCVMQWTASIVRFWTLSGHYDLATLGSTSLSDDQVIKYWEVRPWLYPATFRARQCFPSAVSLSCAHGTNHRCFASSNPVRYIFLLAHLLVWSLPVYRCGGDLRCRRRPSSSQPLAPNRCATFRPPALHPSSWDVSPLLLTFAHDLLSQGTPRPLTGSPRRSLSTSLSTAPTRRCP